MKGRKKEGIRWRDSGGGGSKGEEVLLLPVHEKMGGFVWEKFGLRDGSLSGEKRVFYVQKGVIFLEGKCCCFTLPKGRTSSQEGENFASKERRRPLLGLGRKKDLAEQYLDRECGI